MNWAHYILQANIYLIVFYGFYKLLLDKETYFMLNRIYLLSAGILSLSIPFVRFEWFTTQPVAQPVYMGVDQLNELLMLAQPAQEAPDLFTAGNIAVAIYITGLLVFIFKLLFQLLAIRTLFARSASGVAFSFFNKKIVDHQLPGQQTIHKHEEIHIRQMHTLDVLFFEIISILNWFNPIVYLYKRTIKNIHEYLADEEAARFQGDKKEYALLLLSSAFGVNPHNLTNSFFNKSLIKKRIFMLHKERSTKTAIMKYGLFVPLFAVALILSSATIRNNEEIREVADKLPLEAPINTVKAMVSEAAAKAEPTDWKNFYTHMQRTIRYPAMAQENKTTGHTQIKFNVSKGEVEGANLAGPSLGDGCDTEVMRAILSYPNFKKVPDGKYVIKIAFTLHDDGQQNYVVKNKDLPAVPGYTALSEIVIRGYLARNKSGIDMSKLESDGSGKVHDFTSLDKAPAFPGGMDMFYKYIQTNVKYPKEAQEQNIQGKVFVSYTVETDGTLSDINVERKVGHGLDEEAVRVVRESPKWIPGVKDNMKVRVKYHMPISFSLSSGLAEDAENKARGIDTTKKFSAPGLRGSVNIGGLQIKAREMPASSPTSPLYVVDGVSLNPEQGAKGESPLSTIPQDNILSIEILRDATAEKLYGAAAAKNGVIIITTNLKKPVKPDEEKKTEKKKN